MPSCGPTIPLGLRAPPGSSAPSQQNLKEKAGRIGLEIAHLISTHIPLARTESHGHIYLQGRLGNVVYAMHGNTLSDMEDTLFLAQLWDLGLALDRSRG